MGFALWQLFSFPFLTPAHLSVSFAVSTLKPQSAETKDTPFPLKQPRAVLLQTGAAGTASAGRRRLILAEHLQPRIVAVDLTSGTYACECRA
jgi:hypothetical protein